MSDWIKRIVLKKDSPLVMQGQEEQFGFQRHKPQLMPTSHWHGHIEVNFLFECSATYLISGNEIKVPEGRMIIFWASFPHQMIASKGSGEMVILYLPLKDFLTWNLPHQFIQHLLHGEVIVSNNLHESDVQMAEIWQKDVEGTNLAMKAQVVQEVRDRIRRMVIEPYDIFNIGRTASIEGEQSVIHGFQHLQTMLSYIGEHYDKKLTIGEVTESTGLHKNFAMKLFSRIMRVSIKQYINQLRLQHAQALLVDTDKPVLTIALEAGFGSVSRFYHIFQMEFSMSPLKFRQRALGLDETPK